MQFQDLSEDDIRSIFSFCDIHTVVSMSRTNKYLRQLTLEKLVWVDLVDNIRRKGFIDRLSLSDIQAYSQKALVSLVKGLLTGPTSWNVPITPKLPCLARFQSNIPPPMALSPAQFVIHPSGIRASKKNEAKLLGGGKYVLFNNITLECWSVQHDRLVWSYEKSDPNSYVIEFDAEVSDAGENANIIVCQRSWTTTGDDQRRVLFRHAQTPDVDTFTLKFGRDTQTQFSERRFNQTSSGCFARYRVIQFYGYQNLWKHRLRFLGGTQRRSTKLLYTHELAKYIVSQTGLEYFDIPVSRKSYSQPHPRYDE
ncbi:hypothetical protein C8R44DRAFT_295601 [Mycena epipterygia]|nr:hypothetical protein C8R44DRAFT_295601 [Mycena epipterygia]